MKRSRKWNEDKGLNKKKQPYYPPKNIAQKVKRDLNDFSQKFAHGPRKIPHTVGDVPDYGGMMILDINVHSTGV